MKLFTLLLVLAAVGGSEDARETEKSKTVVPEDLLNPEQLEAKLNEKFSFYYNSLFYYKELMAKLDQNGWENIKEGSELF